MKRLPYFLVLMSIFLLALPSCLTVEKKEYHFEFTGDESGILTIKYINIISVVDDEGDVDNDFNELINTYLEGDLLENEYRFSTLISKRLFEENGYLCAEVKLAFTELTAARLFQYEKNSPLMMSLNASSSTEQYLSSNGNYGGDIMPVVFWPATTPDLKVITTITKPDESSVSLLEKYLEWNECTAQ